MTRRGFAIAAGLLAAAAVLAGCASAPAPSAPAPAPASPDAPPSAPPDTGGEIARNARYALYRPAPGETLATIAQRYLGSADRQWEIEDANEDAPPAGARVLAIPLRTPNPVAVSADGYRAVPILCWHRVGPGVSRMTIAPDRFAEQLEYLKANRYRVLRLSELAEFLDGHRPLPARAVVLTFDDGHLSFYQHAFPLLKKHGFPATMFLYSDFIGARDALKWPQIQEMAESGLVDFQSHSRTHANLVQKLPGESLAAYQGRVDGELRHPRDLIQRQLRHGVVHFAYPYGDTNDLVLERLPAAGYTLGLTVNAGPNAFFAHPFALRRTMVYGTHDLAAFRAMLQTFRPQDLR